jgi:hypothetical protein
MLINTGKWMALNELFNRLMEESRKEIQLPQNNLIPSLPPADLYEVGVKDGLQFV